ncbi:MAG: hypothetical protein KDF59_09530 [Nitrosomonas sp.]|nr:hypothetical protein [Nitrosomonas sp.]
MASTHDSQAAIPLIHMSDERVINLYDLMNSAYDVPQIREASQQLGHVRQKFRIVAQKNRS